MATRNDPHCPSNFIAGDYVPVIFYALAGTCEGWPVPAFNVDRVLALRESGVKFASHGGLGKCTVCGAVFREGEVWKHEPTGEHIHVGHICAQKYDLFANFDLSAYGAHTATQVQRCIRERAIAEAYERHPALASALECAHHIVSDIRARFLSSGYISDKQVALCVKLADEARNPAPAEKHIDAPIGRTDFTGEIVSVKAVDGAYGTTVKLVIKVRAGEAVWLAYITAPRAMGALERGAVHSFRATLKHGREPHFAIGSRPMLLTAG